ncbi:MAG: hypothetical protein E6K54_05985 [Gammaproteobacteria bacterium]|nr:MAG: hypothetical protein E6K54_05985 [Gammaproteobacteria bacterium]
MPNQMEFADQDISGTTNNKTFKIRKKTVQFLILTNSVTPSIEETLLALYNKGDSRSVHHLINREGHQDQFAAEKTIISFTSGTSSFRGNTSLNETAVHVMLLNTGSEAYTQEQKDKLVAFLKDFRIRHSEIDLKINLLGLGEVATSIGDVANNEKQTLTEGEGTIFPRHQAPGKIFWQEMVKELAEQGFGLFIETTSEQKNTVCVSTASSTREITDLQNQLREYGYALQTSGHYDEATKAWVTRFNQRYVPDATLDDSIWSEASQINLDNIVNFISAKTHKVTQSSVSRSDFFTANAPVANTDEVDTQQQLASLVLK